MLFKQMLVLNELFFDPQRRNPHEDRLMPAFHTLANFCWEQLSNSSTVFCLGERFCRSVGAPFAETSCPFLGRRGESPSVIPKLAMRMTIICQCKGRLLWQKVIPRPWTCFHLRYLDVRRKLTSGPSFGWFQRDTKRQTTTSEGPLFADTPMILGLGLSFDQVERHTSSDWHDSVGSGFGSWHRRGQR